MTLQQFLKENRRYIDVAIRSVLRDPDYRLNDDERRLWVLNDESLYRWARSEGVRI